LGFLLAHRPGFVAPPVAARKLATLDQLSGGRLAIHLVAGGSDADQAKDGDWTGHEARYRRATEYLSLLRRTWTEPGPFDHAGEFYRTRGTFSEIRCRQQPHIPIYGGGGSDAAIRALAPHAEVFMLWGEPLKDTARFMDRVRQEAALSGRSPSFSLSTRPILAATEGAAWDRARAILDQVLINRGGAPSPTRQNVGSQRLLQAAAEAEVHDTCLWTPLAAATGAQGNSTALVGTPETVAMALLEYYKLGATSLLIRGYDPRPDAIRYGQELIPRLRELVAEYDASGATGGKPVEAG
jgi:alkanesulfonate monooxygenase